MAIGPAPDKLKHPGAVASFEERIGEVKNVRKIIVELKSILVPLLIVGGWLILYGIVLPALGINT
jgi:hypothetical protein